MDEAHFRPPGPARTAKILRVLTLAALVLGAAGWLQAGWIAAVAGLVVVVVLLVLAGLLNRVELILRPRGIEVVDITGRRRQAWVGTQRLLIDFARPRPLLEIEAPGPSQVYRSTLVLAGLEGDEYAEAREQLEELVEQWAGSNTRYEVRQPDADPAEG